MLSVYANPRFDDFRSGYSGSKRPASVPQPRNVAPRLAQERPSDAVPGPGRRIPASSQRPSRGTNVPLVYSRLAAPPDAAVARHTGDLAFVNKFGTEFGPATSRLSRVAGLAEVNAALSRFTLTVDAAEAVLRERRALLEEYEGLAKWLRAQPRGVRADADKYADLVLERRSCIESAVAEATNSMAAGRDVLLYPEFDWRAVPALAEWRLDGVIYSAETETNVLDHVVPSGSEQLQMVNVCVQGPCHPRNQKFVQFPHFFGERLTAGDFVYACVVAIPDEEARWTFRIALASSRQVCELLGEQFPASVAPPHASSSDFTISELFFTVGAWRLGRVLDTRSVAGMHARFALDVEVTFMDRLHFMRQIIGDDSDSTLLAIACKRVVRVPRLDRRAAAKLAKLVAQRRAARAQTKSPEEPPEDKSTDDEFVQVGPQGESSEELVEDESTDGELVGEEEQPDEEPAEQTDEGPAAAPEAFDIEDSLVDGIVVAARPRNAAYETAYKMGRAAVKVANMQAGVAGGIVALGQLSMEYFSRRNRWFPQQDNTTVAAVVGSFMHADVGSESTLFQKQYFLNSINMTEFVRSVDSFFMSNPKRALSEYEDYCRVLLAMRDNGFTHALCKALDGATRDGKKLFPYTMREPKEGSRVSMLAFKLPPQKGDVMTLEGLVDLSRIADMAPGKDLLTKSTHMSRALNFFFDLPYDRQWSTDDLGVTWGRTTVDRAVWEVQTRSREKHMTHLSDFSNTVGTRYLASNFCKQAMVFGLANLNAVSKPSIRTLSGEAKDVVKFKTMGPTGSGVAKTAPQLTQASQSAIRDLVANSTAGYFVDDQATLSVYSRLSGLTGGDSETASNAPPRFVGNGSSLADRQQYADSSPALVSVAGDGSAIKDLEASWTEAMKFSAMTTGAAAAGLAWGFAYG